MIIKKGTLLVIHDKRKGKYEARAIRDFDTQDEWYQVTPTKTVYGVSNYWDPGEAIPCRKGIATIEIKEMP